MIKTSEMVEVVTKIFNATEAALLDLDVGSRVLMKDLAQGVGLAVAMDPKNVIEFVRYFVHNTDMVFVTRGKSGGVVRGPKPAKVLKKSKKTDSVSDSTETV